MINCEWADEQYVMRRNGIQIHGESMEHYRPQGGATTVRDGSRMPAPNPFHTGCGVLCRVMFQDSFSLECDEWRLGRMRAYPREGK